MKNTVLKILLLFPETLFETMSTLSLGFSFCFVVADMFGLSMDPASPFYNRLAASLEPFDMAMSSLVIAALFNFASCFVRCLVNRYFVKPMM